MKYVTRRTDFIPHEHFSIYGGRKPRDGENREVIAEFKSHAEALAFMKEKESAYYKKVGFRTECINGIEYFRPKTGLFKPIIY